MNWRKRGMRIAWESGSVDMAPEKTNPAGAGFVLIQKDPDQF
jgi:hypothetical protein